MSMECASVQCVGKRLELLEVNCSGFCNKRFHRKCVQLSEYDVSLIIRNQRIKFICDECANKFDMIKNDNEKMIKMLDAQNNAINNIDGKLNSVIDGMKDLEKVRRVRDNYEYNDNKSKALSYAETLQLPVFIKPKEDKKDQLNSVTKQNIKVVLNPAALSVEINNMKELKNNNGVMINCGNKESAEKIHNELLDKIGNDYEVSIPKLENPKLLVVGLSDNITQEAVVRAIESQNSYDFKEIRCHKVYASYKKKGFYNAIVEVDGAAFSNIIKAGKLNVEWNRCMVYEYCKLLRCYKCLGFNHTADKCSIGACCYKCGDKGHVMKECLTEEHKCINCLRMKQKLNLQDLSIDHATRSEDCPLYKRLLKQKQNKILY